MIRNTEHLFCIRRDIIGVKLAKQADQEITARERPLMEATLRIIGRGGIDGVTHRAVAAEAGMSLGAVTHHFATRDILVDAALRFALTREVGRLQALALSLQSKAFDVEAWIEELVGWYGQELKTQPDIHIACYEVFLAAARSEHYRPIVVEWFDTWRQSSELALRAAGSTSSRAHAELFVATLIGILLQQLAFPRRSFRQETKAALLELVEGLIGKK
jgi:TetR/AcrR family transcriptional regulator, regulator of biofilm formation and stress response